MKRKPRRDVIVRRFLEGESVGAIAASFWLLMDGRKGDRVGSALAHVEDAIRWAFEKHRSRSKR